MGPLDHNAGSSEFDASSLSILCLKGDANDSRQIETLLAGAGMDCVVRSAHNREQFVAALAGGGIDLIIAELTLPVFDGHEALRIAHAQFSEIPFVLLAESEQEDEAIAALKDGATDYVLRQHLVRLVPLVQRTLREARDRAACRQMTERFMQAQKMDVVGQLASGVAHDFNNLISIILGYTEQIKHGRQPGDATYMQADEIRLAAERAASLTRQLLIFSRKQTLQLLVLDLNAVLKSNEKMLRRLVDENIELTFLYAEQIGRIRADAGYISQVLMNLVVNARDAMPNGGKLVLETQEAIGADDYVVLRVTDTGHGIDAETQKQIFEPYFTTKSKGKGTGLGLATCQTIVKASGGFIEVESEPGAGATFRVSFPRIDSPVHEEPARPRPQSLPRGTETLLFVEDEPGVRHLGAQVLEGQGYTVLRAPNGQDALRVVREHAGVEIDLVVSDVVMPQMGGKVMAEWLRTTNPELKILFTSGYTDDAITNQGVLEPGIAYLAKPYTSTALTSKVREVLDAAPRADVAEGSEANL